MELPDSSGRREWFSAARSAQNPLVSERQLLRLFRLEQGPHPNPGQLLLRRRSCHRTTSAPVRQVPRPSSLSASVFLEISLSRALSSFFLVPEEKGDRKTHAGSEPGVACLVGTGGQNETGGCPAGQPTGKAASCPWGRGSRSVCAERACRPCR